MRKYLLVFLMIFLPLQWTVAMAADCCLRHDAQTPDHHAQMMQDHHDHQQHSKAEQPNEDGKQVKNDCNMNCAGCHAHHSACAVFEVSAVVAKLPSAKDDTPYVSGITSPLPDNLFRPPLAALA